MTYFFLINFINVFFLIVITVIMQWVILAVRNLCENCPENQVIFFDFSEQIYSNTLCNIYSS